MDALQLAFSKKERDSEAMRSFGFRLRNQFTQNKSYRRSKELEWLESLRQYKGLYDPDVKINDNASKVYPKITRSKVNIVLSRLHELLFPELDKNWEITPTPEPKVSKETVTKIVTALIESDPQTGGQKLPSVEDIRLAIKDYAKATSERMSSVIDDQLSEMDYPEETKKVLRSGLMYGTGIMKGPLVGKRTKRRWAPAKTGTDYEEFTDEEDVPDLQFTRLWDWYPDMSVTDIEQSEGSFERHIMNKHDLRKLMKRDDFYPEMIEQFLKDYPDGNYTPENWETELQTIEIEAGSGRGEVGFSTVAGNSSDRNAASNRQMGRKYEVLEFWGYIDGNDLSACGLDIPDVSLEYAGNIWLLGDRPIKALLFPTALDQYKVFYYEKDETSIFGEGLAKIMRHSQLAIAASARMVLDNAACVAGPQVEVNWNLMTEDTDLSSFYPRKIWYREGKGIDAQYPALRVYNIDSHVDELLKIIDAFKQFGDEETTLPTWMIGQMVNNETAQATSGRMATITVSIKDVVKNFDAFTEKVMRDLYAWNMEFNPRQDIKGDYQCRARGVSSLVMKEVRMQALNQLATTLTDQERDYIPTRDLLSERFKAHDIAINLLTEEEVQKVRDAREQSIQAQLQIEMLKSEISKNKAQSLSLLTKAKEHNVLATKEAQTPPETTPADDPRLAEADLQQKEIDRMASESQIRRDEERHQMEMAHAGETHNVKVAVDTTKAASEIANKGKMTEAAIKMKEEMAKTKAKQAKTAPKTKPVAKKVK